MNRKTVPTCASCSSDPDELAARECEAYLGAQDPINVAAAEWHTRREQGLVAEEEAEFQHWLSATPAHQVAFARLDEGIRFLRTLPSERVAPLRNLADVAPASFPTAPQPQAPDPTETGHRWRRPFRGVQWGEALSFRATAVALCCVTFLAIGAGWYEWQQQPTFTSSYAAERGQRLDIPLPDGSTLNLDADTHVEVLLYRNRREVKMAHGQALFSVSHDPTKPFEVLAGSARVTVVGTRFSVRYTTTGIDAGNVDVAVEEGHVKVADATLEHGNQTGNPRLVELSAGQGVQVSPSGGLGDVSTIPPASIAPWRRGLVHFSSTPLAEAVLELERYGPSNLVISDPEVAALRIGGSYQIGRPSDFARVLPQILPVRLVARGDGKTEIVKAH